MGHQCCSKQKVKRGLWSPEEDEKLIRHITTHGHGSWSSVPKLAGLQRCGKSCRLRWINYLRPDLKRGSFSAQEERTIIDVHRMLGNRWAQIAKHLPGRTDNEVKNFWNSSIKKKLVAQGLDPNTHNLLPPHHHHSQINISKNVSKFSLTHQKPTSSVYSMNSQQMLNDIKTTCFTTFPTIVPPNETLLTSEYQNPNIMWPNIEEEKNPNSFMEMEQCHSESQCSMRSIPNSYSPINQSGFGILDDNCMWGGGFEGFETTGQEEQVKKVCEMEIEKTNMDFDFEFVESTLVSLWNV